MTKIATAAFVATLGAACAAPQMPSEHDAYKLARQTSDVAAISLDVAALALHARVEADADRRAAMCGGEGDNLKRCRHNQANAALAEGRPLADTIDAAAALQIEVRNALVAYEACSQQDEGMYCRAAAVSRAAARAPELVKAVSATREAMRKNVDPPR